MTLRAGIVGCGRIGCGFEDDPRRAYVSTHARAYAVTPGIELNALCDTDTSKLQRYGAKFRVPGLYTDYVEMFAREKLDIASVCTRSTSRVEIVRAAVEAGVRGIFCEKPIAESLSAADEIVELCKNREVALIVGHQRRFDPVHQRLAAFVRSGGLGSVQQVTCYYTAGVANTGTHLFDLLRFYLGEIAWVEGRFSANASMNRVDPNIDGWIGFANGAAAAIQACDVSAYAIFEIALLGAKGRLRLKSHCSAAEFEESRNSERFFGYRELFQAKLPVEGDFTQDLLSRGVIHLMDCVERGAAPVSSGRDGRAALEAVCALSQSAIEGGRRIGLPLANTSLLIPSN